MMEEIYFFDITFPGIDFDAYMPKTEPSNTLHHVNLYTRGNEIELKVFYEPATNFGRKFNFWVSKINWRKFGSFIKANKISRNERLIKIDFTNASLLGVISSTDYYEGNLQYISVKIDTVKFYWIPAVENINTAEFYFNDAGFRVVKDFYAPLFGTNNEFNISRMNGMDVFYPVGIAEFRPEFNFCFGDDKNNNQAIISKEPKLQFRYKEKVSEKEAIKYGEVISLLSSFYFHTKIDFILTRILLPEHTITIKKIQKKNYYEPPETGGLWGVKIYWDFHEFLQKDWQQQTFLNYDKLSRVIELYNQSLIVDQNSKFLIRYNIIEICMGGKKSSDAKFTQIVTDKEKRTEYNNALACLLKTISTQEKSLFEKKWAAVCSKLYYKPMKSPLKSFLSDQKLPVEQFPIPIDRLKEIRDDLTHGSFDRIKADELEKANIFLYHITTILILNLLGIREWKLDINLK
jgi:hypothetical protein